jgi:hypothetical protein
VTTRTRTSAIRTRVLSIIGVADADASVLALLLSLCCYLFTIELGQMSRSGVREIGIRNICVRLLLYSRRGNLCVLNLGYVNLQVQVQ